MTPEELSALTLPWRAAARQLREAESAIAALRPERDRYIRQAVSEGMTLRTVAEAVGGAPNGLLSGQRVSAICNDTERTTQ